MAKKKKDEGKEIKAPEAKVGEMEKRLKRLEDICKARWPTFFDQK